MRLLLTALVVVATLPSLWAQGRCTKGTCVNGYNEYKFDNGDEYKGQFLGGKFSGQGIIYYKSGDKYLGNWASSMRQGRGRLEFANKDVYLGLFEADRFSGEGTLTYANGNIYKGNWLGNQPSGFGKLTYATGAIYEGDFKEGLMDGEGTMTYSDGAQYTGQWKSGKREGEGKMLMRSGENLVGTWKNDQYQAEWNKVTFPADTISLRNCNTNFCSVGIGKFTYKNGDRFIGDFRDGKPNGSGITYFKNGNRYEGDWRNDSPNGKGVMQYQDGKIVGAIWETGKPVQQLFEDVAGEKGSPSLADVDKQVKIWAIVIGAARYTSMPLLKYTDDDAYQIYAFLKSPEGGAIPDNQIRLLIDEDATRSNILYSMRSIFGRADANDVILFYFSGHGIQGAFLPIDYDGVKNQLLHTEVRDLLMSSKAKHKIVLADACHSGGLLAMKSVESTELSKFYKAFEDSRGGTALLMSSRGEEYSLEDSGLRSGVFSHFIIRGLKGEADQSGNKLVSVQELYNFVYKQVRKYTANVQSPTLTGVFDPNMPIAVVR